MATYAIGDIQGCYQSLKKLLKKIRFDPLRDRLWLAGDLINRGPDSLGVMQFILENEKCVTAVLGNHDLHFLAVVNECRAINDHDTFDDILDSSMKFPVTNWLNQQPLAHHSKKHKILMVHAGLPVFWSLKKVLSLSLEVSQRLQSASCYQFYVSMYGNYPNQWNKDLEGLDRLRFITNALTRMRYWTKDRELDLKAKGNPNKVSHHLTPWFDMPKSKYKGDVVFGHWASLQGQCGRQGYYAIDTGCSWGRKLTALRLEDRALFSVASAEK